ncbi:MAG: acyl carrier protein [Hamadaea sp.]|uniref:acyl carrier protein n=1 Tax=Hamadaea sp. TaxID=2024425 RepID=UPI0017AD5C2F|nr:acyl carrier protein [Hamadaea sp.]NUR32299.1 acyl carrier protein [Catenulispora sp.]NUR72858.1 acyl carrier protein [Hamadaea sp.]NUT20860.1 acyl carrier protein [Hamadaea sp.]
MRPLPDPQTPADRALHAIEATIGIILGRSIGPAENFFEAGLRSLDLVRLHEVGARELTVEPPVTVMFAYPNLQALRRHLTGEVTAADFGGRTAAASQVRRVGNARRELRKRNRSESEPQ